MGKKANNQGGPDIEMIRAMVSAANKEIARANEALVIILDHSGVALTSAEVEDIRSRRQLGIKLS